MSQVEFGGVLRDKYVGGLQDWLHFANVIVRLASVAEPAILFVSLRILYEFEHMLCQPTRFRSLSVACACKLLAGCVGRSNLLGNVDRRSNTLLQNHSRPERFFSLNCSAQLFNFAPFIFCGHGQAFLEHISSSVTKISAAQSAFSFLVTFVRHKAAL